MSFYFDRAIEISPENAKHVTVEFNSDGSLIIWTNRPIFAKVATKNHLLKDPTVAQLNLTNEATPEFAPKNSVINCTRGGLPDEYCFLCDHAEICALHEKKKIPIQISSDDSSDESSASDDANMNESDEMSEILKKL